MNKTRHAHIKQSLVTSASQLLEMILQQHPGHNRIVIVRHKCLGRPSLKIILSQDSDLCHPDMVHPRIDFLDEDIIKRCKSKNLPINVWTVNSEISIEKCKRLGVHGIITDLEKI